MGAAPQTKKIHVEEVTHGAAKTPPMTNNPLDLKSETPPTVHLVNEAESQEYYAKHQSLRVTTGVVVAFSAAVVGYFLADSLGVLCGIVLGTLARCAYLFLFGRQHKINPVDYRASI